MGIKIDKKITGYNVVKPEDKAPPTYTEVTDEAAIAAPIGIAMAEVIQMHERLERPEVLIGSTYKIKSPLVEHAMYVTINDIVLNHGSEHELRRPFEVFINSKSMDHFQWIVALTRIMSAVFRKGGDVTFLVEEMKAVFDPRGGYFKAGGVYMPSIVAEIGAVVEEHMKSIGLIVGDELSDAQKQLIADKRAAYDARAKKNSEISAGVTAGAHRTAHGEPVEPRPQPGDAESVQVTGEGTSFPPSATLCHKCSAKAMIMMDGCATCLNCGYSKCG